jgi:hypothetical protein
MQEKVSCMRHLVKIEKSVTSGELFWQELGRAAFPQKQFPLGDRFFHLHPTLMQDTYTPSRSDKMLTDILCSAGHESVGRSLELRTYLIILLHGASTDRRHPSCATLLHHWKHKNMHKSHKQQYMGTGKFNNITWKFEMRWHKFLLTTIQWFVSGGEDEEGWVFGDIPHLTCHTDLYQRFFSVNFIDVIRSCSQWQNIPFFPNLRRKIPNCIKTKISDEKQHNLHHLFL